MKTIQEVLTKRLDIITSLYQDYCNNPFESDLSHDLRVSLRELRALFNIIKPAVQTEVYKELSQALRDSGQIFGPVREIDVLVASCSQLAYDQPTLTPYYYDLFHFLDIERRQEMRRTFNKTSVGLIEDTLKKTRQVIESLEDHVQDQDWDEFITKRLNKKYKKMQNAYEDLNQDDYEAVHSLRKDAKKVRYGAKYFKKLVTIKTKHIRRVAESLQDELGKYTDRHVNLQLLEEFAKKAESEEVTAALTDIREYQNNQ
ncbi:CHAD domain-containing protein [Aerococcaceae bacterium WGS1372]